MLVAGLRRRRRRHEDPEIAGLAVLCFVCACSRWTRTGEVSRSVAPSRPEGLCRDEVMTVWHSSEGRPDTMQSSWSVPTWRGPVLR